MNWLFPGERLHYRQHGPFDRHVFQSRHQRNQLVPQLRRFGFGDEQGRVIRGSRMSSREATIDYIGWVGHDNLGDEACLLAIRTLLGRQRRVKVRPTHEPTSPVVILGGGTLLYGTAFLKTAECALRQGAKLFVFGTGVDLVLPVQRWGDRRLRWSRLLEAASLVSVRGPASLAAVHQLGIRSARVIGDPALVLEKPPTKRDCRETNLVLLNAGSDFPPPGGARRLLPQLGRAVEGLFASGYQVEYVALRPNDVERARPLIERFRLNVIPPHLPTVLRRIDRSRFVVATRLHAAVLAAACGVPPVLLAYHPKHRDFAASIGWEEYLINTRSLQANDVLAALHRLEDRRADAVEHLRRVRGFYRGLQQAAADFIGENAKP